MIIQLPTKYVIEYPYENRAYYTGTGKTKHVIESLLKSASKGYCMYCGVALKVEGMDLSQIEHSVDKSGNKHQEGRTPLSNCKYNLSVACKDCNMKYKKSVNKVELLNRFKSKCPSKCKEPCNDYVDLRNEYIRQNKIILQPYGIKSSEGVYEVLYNVFKHLYIPGTTNEDQSSFIQHHIIRFHLNREKFSESIIEICADIVELNELGVCSAKELLKYISRKKQSNIIGVQFLNQLNKIGLNQEIEPLLRFCKTVVILSAWI